MNHNFLHTILFLSCCSWLQISSTIAFPWDPKVQTKYGEIEGEFKSSVKDLYKVNNEWYNTY